MARHPDRPAWERQRFRRWKVTLKDGREFVMPALHRAEARHYSRSWREEPVSSGDHYRDIASVRLVGAAMGADDYSEDIPF